MIFEVCPFHSLDDVEGMWVSEDVGWKFTCDRSDHVPVGSYVWLRAPQPPAETELSGIAEELGLSVEIPAVLAEFHGRWVEYGVFEHAYARSHHDDWVFLMERYGHTAVAAKRYTVSAFLAGTLGHLTRTSSVRFHAGPATGRWAYNSTISYWSLAPEPDWAHRLSWADSGLTVAYVPGQTEVS